MEFYVKMDEEKDKTLLTGTKIRDKTLLAQPLMIQIAAYAAGAKRPWSARLQGVRRKKR